MRLEDFSEESVDTLRTWALKCKEHNTVVMYMMKVGSDGAVRHLVGLQPKRGRGTYKYIRGLEFDSGLVKKIWPLLARIRTKSHFAEPGSDGLPVYTVEKGDTLSASGQKVIPSP